MALTTSPRTVTRHFQNFVRHRLFTAGYEITSVSWCTLDSRKWGFSLTTGQRIGISFGGAGDPDAIYIVVSGPDAQPVRRVLKPFERPSAKDIARRQRRAKKPWWRHGCLPVGYDPNKQEPGYCYHGTRRRWLRSIARQGLMPHEPGPGEGAWDDPDRADWLPGEEEEAFGGRVFASSAFDVALDTADVCRNGVVLRMPLDSRWDWRRGAGDLFAIDPIEPESIEVLWDDANWHPLLELVATLPARRRLTTIWGIRFVKD
jgi:hypothetical protein